MTTTFEAFAGATRQNYSTLPTLDVEILTDPDQCQHCGKVIVLSGPPGSFDPWRHQDGSEGHAIAAVPRCRYCRGKDDLSSASGPWHDGVRCGRCGGEVGYPIGD